MSAFALCGSIPGYHYARPHAFPQGEKTLRKELVIEKNSESEN